MKFKLLDKNSSQIVFGEDQYKYAFVSTYTELAYIFKVDVCQISDYNYFICEGNVVLIEYDFVNSKKEHIFWKIYSCTTSFSLSVLFHIYDIQKNIYFKRNVKLSAIINEI